MVEMVCRYTMVAVSQQAGNIVHFYDFTYNSVCCRFGLAVSK